MNGTEILLTIKLKETLFADPKRIRLLQEIENAVPSIKRLKMPMSVIKALGITLRP